MLRQITETGNTLILKSNTEDSLSGKNSRRRASGAGSSPALSAKLFKKLRNLDRRITLLKGYLQYDMLYPAQCRIYRETINKLDHQRKKIRNQRKAYICQNQ